MAFRNSSGGLVPVSPDKFLVRLAIKDNESLMCLPFLGHRLLFQDPGQTLVQPLWNKHRGTSRVSRLVGN